MSKKTLRNTLYDSTMLVTDDYSPQWSSHPSSSNIGVDDLEDDDNSTNSGSDDDDDLNGGDDDDNISGGLGDDDLDGGDGDDDLDGEDDDDHLSGGGGCDSLHGGHGNDDLDGGDDDDSLSGGIGDDELDGGSGDDDLDGEEDDDALTGGSGDDDLDGGEGDDDLDGGLGCDSMYGGDGDDDYFIDNAKDAVTEFLDQGTDTVNSSCSFVLGDNVENLILTGRSGNSGRGNALDNVLTGNAGNNLLDGGAGADMMSGGGGSDTYIVDDDLDQVEESDASRRQSDTVKTYVDYTLGDNIENLAMMAGGHKGTGNALDNLLTGSDGDDTLDGAVGADKMVGGNGSDLYFVDNVKDSVKENNSDKTGVDAVHSSVSHTLSSNVENLVLTGAAVAGVGNSGNNKLIGNDLGNALAGKSGNDFLDGGFGDDVLCGGSGADTFNFSADAGVDRVMDFNALQGDKLDISDFLTGYDPLTSVLEDFIKLETTGAETILKVDMDGAGTAFEFQNVAVLTNLKSVLVIDDLITSDSLIMV